jgi:hypothetical protein
MGKHPTYINDLIPGSLPLSIPHHSEDVKIGTARSILLVLENDLDQLSDIYTD